MAPTVHLIYGPSGAGKSTHAHQLATDHHAVRFAIDDWMHGLYGDDRPARLDMAWVLPRLRRCEALIWQTSRQILDTGRDVVLDLGLMRRADRARLKNLAAAAGHAVQPCFVNADRALRWQRVQRRNADKGDGYSFEVTQAMFDGAEAFFEPPTEEELGASPTGQTETAHG